MRRTFCEASRTATLVGSLSFANQGSWSRPTRTTSAALAHARELRRLHFDRMRILLGRGEALDFDARAADRLGERLQVRRGGDDAQLLL